MTLLLAMCVTAALLATSQLSLASALALLALLALTVTYRPTRATGEASSEPTSASHLPALGIMASGIAHEINNPLAVIKGRIDILRLRMEQGPPTVERLEHELEIMERNVERIANIIRMVRQLAGEESRERIEKVKVATLIETALAFCSQRLANHGIELIHETTVDDVEIECSKVELSQALFNVLQNAHDAALSGSEHWIRLATRDTGEAVEIRVSDSGPGIAPADRDKILLPFFTTKAPGKGMGLGLSVAQGLIARHGGSLSLDVSAPRTTFVIRLPKRITNRQFAAA